MRMQIWIWFLCFLFFHSFPPVSCTASSSIRKGKNGNKNGKSIRKIIIVIACSIGGLVLLTIAAYLLWNRRRHPNIARNLSIGMVENDDIQLRCFTLNDIGTVTENFSKKNVLGEGGSAVVYKGTMPGSPTQEIAVKRLTTNSEQSEQEVINEAKLLSRLQHRNVISLLGWCNEEGEHILIYEYMAGKSLNKHIFGKKTSQMLDLRQKFAIIRGVGEGLAYLHHGSRIRVIHRDLKPENILLDREMKPKISDFGLSRILPDDGMEVNSKPGVGTWNKWIYRP